MVAVALIGYALAPALGWMLACTIPLGLGAGAIDTGLNNFAATHWSARQMSWLHCFWGVGASLGPMLMSAALASNGGWRLGYVLLGIVELSVALLLAATLRLWPAETVPQPSAADPTSPRRPVAARKGRLTRARGELTDRILFPVFGCLVFAGARAYAKRKFRDYPD